MSAAQPARHVAADLASRMEDARQASSPAGWHTRGRSFSETSGAAGYSHLGSVVWAGVGSVDFTPGAGRGSGRQRQGQLCGSMRQAGPQAEWAGRMSRGRSQLQAEI